MSLALQHATVSLFLAICQHGQLQSGKVDSRFATCNVQSANDARICPICKLWQPISFHIMELFNVGEQRFEILMNGMSVNIYEGQESLLYVSRFVEYQHSKQATSVETI